MYIDRPSRATASRLNKLVVHNNLAVMSKVFVALLVLALAGQASGESVDC